MKVRIATRGSALALWQAEYVARYLGQCEPGCESELIVVKTTGDRVTDRPLREVGGKGLFVKEIQETVLSGRADVAVHSMKDLPNDESSPLELACVPERVDPRDVLVVAPGIPGATMAELPAGISLGTSSLRRACQVTAVRPDIQIAPLRGNLDTRLRKVKDGTMPAAIVAAAGIVRLGLTAHIRAYLPIPAFVPAGAQGALAIEVTPGRADLVALFAGLHHAASAQQVLGERAFLRRMQGSCDAPLGVHGWYHDESLHMLALAGRVSDGTILRAQGQARPEQAIELGYDLAEQLIGRGARQFWQ